MPKRIYEGTFRERNKQAQAKYREKNKDRVRELNKKARLKSEWNLSVEEYEKLLESQNGVCAICEKPEQSVDYRTNKPRKLAIDHCHKTGKIRGLLCGNCNLGLGKFKDSLDVLRNAINYLEK